MLKLAQCIHMGLADFLSERCPLRLAAKYFDVRVRCRRNCQTKGKK